MSTTSPPKPWQTGSSTTTTATAAPVSALTTTPSTTLAATTANSRLKPWEREASAGRNEDDMTGRGNIRRTESPGSYDSTSMYNTGTSRYGSRSTYGSSYGGTGYGSSYGGTGYGSSYGGSGYGSSYGGSGYGSSYGGTGYGSSYGGTGYGDYGGIGSGYGSSGYGSGYGSGGYGSSYGGYGSGGYGSSYGGIGSGYGSGGYGSNYGGYGNQFSKYGPPTAGNLDWRGVADQGFQWVHGVHSVTAGFGRFAGLLDANSQAMHGALSGIVRLIENAGYLYREIGMAISGITVFRLMQRVFKRMLGKKDDQANTGNGAVDAAVNEFQKAHPPSRAKFWIYFLASIAAVVFALPFLSNVLKKYAGPEDNLNNAWNSQQQPTPGNPNNPALLVRATHDYPAQEEHELSLKQGDIIVVTQKPFEAWWQGEIQGQFGRVGLFPTNYTRPLQPTNGATPVAPNFQ